MCCHPIVLYDPEKNATMKSRITILEKPWLIAKYFSLPCEAGACAKQTSRSVDHPMSHYHCFVVCMIIMHQRRKELRDQVFFLSIIDLLIYCCLRGRSQLSDSADFQSARLEPRLLRHRYLQYRRHGRKQKAM